VRAAFRDHAGDLLAYFERRVEIREDAADLLGETMLQAWRRVDAFPTGEVSHQRMWLYRIAANVLANHRRSSRRRVALSDRLRGHLHASRSEEVGDAADGAAVRDAVLRLPVGQRDLVMLVHWDGLTLAEAAELLALNASTARSRYAAARAALRESLTAHPLA
jgi:RNA polymerase sigma-70 factor (ECF subfamily)